jgi:glutamate synthase (NADPH/NADH) large chain
MTGGVVVILGPTGRNLGAGMSGGKAYVLDLRPTRVTPGALETGVLLADSLDKLDAEGFDDAERVISLISKHVEQTWSRVGADLLAAIEKDRAGTLRRFTRLVPREWARMNEALASAAASGLDYHDPQVWAGIMKEVSHG